jgi:hypothetical protein
MVANHKLEFGAVLLEPRILVSEFGVRVARPRIPGGIMSKAVRVLFLVSAVSAASAALIGAQTDVKPINDLPTR